MEEEEILSRTVKLLEQGCTMLASHHSCGAPLFRCKGDIICPVCSFSAEDKDLKAEKRASETLSEGRAIKGIGSKVAKLSEAQVGYQRDHELVDQIQGNGATSLKSPSAFEQLGVKAHESWQIDLPKSTRDALKNAIVSRMGELTDDLLRERDLSRLKYILDCIETELKVLKLLSQRKGYGKRE